ncbi:MAG: hypothetical protein H7A24_02500 [Leptospiraceae bacterium]|nr:hypothetical protein [Leptospiraceae bacterium]MCP5510721.1 hypothetical protein [Leptospiraceae bacterium]
MIFYLFLFLFPLNLAFAEQLKEGEEWTLTKFPNQWDDVCEVTPDSKKILFTGEMETSKIAHKILEKEKPESFYKRGFLFLSDVRKMPDLITRFVAIPKMRSYSYPICLIKEGEIANDIPREKGKLSLVYLRNGKIEKILFSNDPTKVVEFYNSP